VCADSEGRIVSPVRRAWSKLDGVGCRSLVPSPPAPLPSPRQVGVNSSELVFMPPCCLCPPGELEPARIRVSRPCSRHVPGASPRASHACTAVMNGQSSHVGVLVVPVSPKPPSPRKHPASARTPRHRLLLSPRHTPTTNRRPSVASPALQLAESTWQHLFPDHSERRKYARPASASSPLSSVSRKEGSAAFLVVNDGTKAHVSQQGSSPVVSPVRTVYIASGRPLSARPAVARPLVHEYSAWDYGEELVRTWTCCALPVDEVQVC
jgi:hypothetical protein